MHLFAFLAERSTGSSAWQSWDSETLGCRQGWDSGRAAQGGPASPFCPPLHRPLQPAKPLLSSQAPTHLQPPLPTFPISSSAFSPSHFLPSFFTSSSVNHLRVLHMLPQSAPLLFFCSFALFFHCSQPSSTEV